MIGYFKTIKSINLAVHPHDKTIPSSISIISLANSFSPKLKVFIFSKFWVKRKISDKLSAIILPSLEEKLGKINFP